MSYVLRRKNIVGRPGKEAVEVVGEKGPYVGHCVISGGSACLRFVDCTDVMVEYCSLGNMAGPADPDGQAIQFIRSTGTIRYNGVSASDNAEDLISIYADVPMPKGSQVSVYENRLYGKGKSPSSTGICLDGPHCPYCYVYHNAVYDARVGIMLAGGYGHNVNSNLLKECAEQDVYIDAYYDYSLGAFGGFSVQKNTLSRPVGLGARPGTGNKIQKFP